MERQRWSWWEYPLFPLAALLTALSIAIPWLRTRGPLKLFVTFMALWIFWGIMAVNFDSGAATWNPNESITRFQLGLWEEGDTFCDPEGSQRAAGMPFGKGYIIVIDCSTHAIRLMLDSVGLDSQADWVVDQWVDTRYGYYVLGEFSVAYVYLGLLTFLSIFVFPIWAVVALIYLLVSKVNLSWG